MAKKTPEINATSTADIAFLLLVFFLATTTMNVDSGMFRRLPPYQPDNTEAPKIAQRNILQILVNKDNMLQVGGEPLDVNRLKEKALEFILNPMNDPNLPETSPKEIEGLGNVDVSKGVISLQSDKGTSYEMYIAVQDQLAAAFSEARDRKAKSKWGKKYNDLNSDQQEAIKKWVPMSISEAEPKNIGGKKK
ncbi:MAG: biopolymer transporter ExbD [Oscillibacter sp.]|nr:biopolymer transporter ExbD [Oscillibacter sp.]